jgi:hypothetical protein
MSYFYSSPTSNIPPQPQQFIHPSAIRMTRTGSSSSTTSSTSSDYSSSIAIPSPYNSASRPGSSSASFSSSYWSSSSAISSPSSSYAGSSRSRHNSNGTSYLPTPFRSSLLHSSSSNSIPTAPSSYFSDDELLSLSLESTHLSSTPQREMTTEEQVAAVREHVEREREREGMKPEAWWQNQGQNQVQNQVQAEKRSRVVRFAGESRPSGSGSSRRGSGQKRRGVVVVGSGKGSSRRD